MKNDNSMHLGKAIAAARGKKGKSLRQLEAETGISNATICQIESGHIKEPAWWKIVDIAKALSLNLDKLAACR